MYEFLKTKFYFLNIAFESNCLALFLGSDFNKTSIFCLKHKIPI